MSCETLPPALRAICDGTATSNGRPMPVRTRLINIRRFIAAGLLPAGFIPPDIPVDPSPVRRAVNYAAAQVRHTLDDRTKVTPEQFAARVAVCAGCPLLNPVNRVCRDKACGCPVDAKAWWASEDCPQQLWPLTTTEVADAVPEL